MPRTTAKFDVTENLPCCFLFVLTFIEAYWASFFMSDYYLAAKVCQQVTMLGVYVCMTMT